MPLTLNSRNWPVCCGYILTHGEVTCQCIVCGKEYETAGLRRFIEEQPKPASLDQDRTGG